MAKANIVTNKGTKITIDGSAAEVAAILKQIDSEKTGSAMLPLSKVQQEPVTGRTKKKPAKPTPVNLISSLIDGGFFRKPKDLGAVKVALEEMGHYYPVTTLSPSLLRFVRRHELRRIKDGKRWAYTG
jgi:hypothetical protein